MKECSSVLRNQVKRQETLLANNFTKLQLNIQSHVTHAKNRLSDNNAVLEKKILEKNYLLRLMEKIRYTETVILKACSEDGSNGSTSASKRKSNCSSMAVEEDSIEFKYLYEAYFGDNQIRLLKYYLLKPSSSPLLISSSSSSSSSISYFLALSLADLSLVLDGGWTALLKGSHSGSAFLLSPNVEDSIRSLTSLPSSSSTSSASESSSSTASSAIILYTLLMCSLEAPSKDLSVSNCKDRLLMEAILICSHQQSPYCNGQKLSFLQSKLEGHSHGLLYSASETSQVTSSIHILAQYQGLNCFLLIKFFFNV